jgi:SAM-dependent methyltransferase
MQQYVHGYSKKETVRLNDHAQTLAELLHHDSLFPAGSRVLEAGCGTGAQTVHLARLNPQIRITAVDLAESSLEAARARIAELGFCNVEFMRADVNDAPFEPDSFDHIFVCFVLEHLARPVEVLSHLKRVLKLGGTITVIEGDHGSTFFHPESSAARMAIGCQVELQARAGGNALIGRELYPLLNLAGFRDVRVSPRMVYVDAGRPGLVDGFTRKTFTAMIEGVRQSALEAGLIDASDFDRGIRDLYRTTEPDGVFCYTFFKAFGAKTL